MGKKRRLNKAKAKFAHKLSAHPRARLLATQTSSTDDVRVEIENVSNTHETMVVAEVEAVTTQKKEVVPKIEAPRTTPKKTARTKRPPAKKKTTTRKSAAKKAASTEKRA
tara:strand:+ start:22735 stop:23064 length:330 start_codon:yes stop_codon:yes gene_type:complete